MPIDTLIFDVGGVLMDVQFSRTNRQLEKHCPALPPMDETASLAYWGSIFYAGEIRLLHADYARGKVSTSTVVRRSRELLHSASGYQGSEADFLSSFTSMCCGLIEANYKVFAAALKKYKVGVISDNTEAHTRWSETHYPELFHALPRERLILSQEVGLLKEDGPEIFLLALRRLGSLPQNAVMIDDSEHKLVQARAAGLHTIKITPQTNLSGELSKLGVSL